MNSKDSTAPALAWPNKVQVQQFVLAYVCPVASSISAAIVSDCDLRERWLPLTPTEAICVNRDVCSLVLLLDRGGQVFVVRVDDKDRKQLCRLGLARIAADRMAGTRRLEETLAGAVDPLWSVVHLRFDFSGHDIGENESRFRVRMRRRRPARSIVNDKGDE
jgi:hypothetical protein